MTEHTTGENPLIDLPDEVKIDLVNRMGAAAMSGESLPIPDKINGVLLGLFIPGSTEEFLQKCIDLQSAASDSQIDATQTLTADEVAQRMNQTQF